MPTPTQAISDSSIQNLLFEVVHPTLLDAINLRSVERKLFDVEKREVNGKYYKFEQLTGGNFRLEGRQEGGYLPGQNPSSALQDQAAGLVTLETRVKRRFEYSSIEFTGPMDNAPRDGTGGFKKLSAVIMEQTTKAFPEMMSSKWARNQCGILGEVASVSGNTITLVAANAPTTAATSRPWAGNRFFREGMVVDIVTNNGSNPNPTGALRTGANDKGRRITGKSADGTTPTLTMQDISSTTLDAGDLLIPTGERQDGAIDTQSEFEDGFYGSMGIMDAIQDGSDGMYSMSYMGNVAVSGQRVLQSHKVANTTNANLSLKMLNLLCEQMLTDDLSGKEPDFFYTTPGVYRQFADAFTTMANFSTNNPARYNNPGKGFTPTVGVSGIEVNNIGSSGSKKIFTSPFAPHYRCYGVSKGGLIQFEDKELGIMQDDGLKLRQIPGTDMWSVAYKRYSSGIFAPKPRDHGYITGLNGDQNNL